MQFAKRFLDKFSSLIVTVLSCFDRVIFKGYLPFHSEGEMNSWVDYTLRIRRVDFVTQLEQRSEELVDHAKAFAAKASSPYRYRQGGFRKEQFIQDIIRWDNVTEQAEYASDVIFKDRSKLRDLYPRLLDHAVVDFSASDILTFLGRKLTENFLGEVLTDCKKKREPGARVKHRVKENWIKMRFSDFWGKCGLVLRVETVINSPREFRVRRKRIPDKIASAHKSLAERPNERLNIVARLDGPYFSDDRVTILG